MRGPAETSRPGRVSRKTWLLLGVVAVAGVLLLAACTAKKKEAAPAALKVFPGGYVGAEACGKCHQNRYDGWKASGHASMLRTGEEARLAGVPKPSYVSWTDIAYVIGGKNWKARYVGKDGYLITGGTNPETKAVVKGQNEFLVATGQFDDAKPGEKVQYGCGQCHTTGYKPEGHQGGLEGIAGTWAFAGVQCEVCHGPGADHAKSKKKEDLKVADPSTACVKCHGGKDLTVISAKEGWVGGGVAAEVAASPHKKLGCVQCHRPHRPRGSFAKKCEDCHSSVAARFASSEMAKAGVSCTDCHMAPAAKEAFAANRFTGDRSVHLFRVNLNPNASLFYTKGGEQFVNGKNGLTLDFVCLRCHADRTKAWAADEAKDFHD